MGLPTATLSMAKLGATSGVRVVLESNGGTLSLSMAAVFARRDWEHAVGAHYTESFIGWLMASVET